MQPDPIVIAYPPIEPLVSIDRDVWKLLGERLKQKIMFWKVPSFGVALSMVGIFK